MSRRQDRPRRPIMGPQSALTDFLASHNISAAQIRDEAQRRRAAAANQENQPDQQDDNSTPAATTPATEVQPTTGNANSRSNENKTRQEKRKKETQKAIDKIKASKKFKQRKRRLGEDVSDDDDSIARAIFEEHSAPLPGQMENCAICGKRFTVTPYSRAGPEGGLLCNPCGKELDKDNGSPKKKKPRSGGPVGRRRKMQSNILDGTYQTGAKSLMTLCIETLARNIDLAEDLGDLPAHTVDKIARLLSKKRLLDPRTLQLFLQPTNEDVPVYDASKLRSDDLLRILQTVPSLKNLKIRNAIQFKDEVMDYLLSRHIELEALYLHGANLLSEEKWQEYLKKKGKALKSLKVYYTDRHFGDETLALFKAYSPSLNRLKISNNQKVSSDGIRELASLNSLEHLSLQLHKPVHPDIYVRLLGKIGPGLKTLSLSKAPELDNTVLDAIHTRCVSLHKLRITESELMTDDGFVRLFTGWKNPPLAFIDLQKNRQLDSTQPRENKDSIGLCSDGFRALMEHSGKALRFLNVHACRHISSEAFEDVFSPDKTYPELKNLEISFCEEVTDFVVGNIFRSCPNLHELNVFGCMKVKGVRVPRGKILVGVPNAVGMQIEGHDELDPQSPSRAGTWDAGKSGIL